MKTCTGCDNKFADDEGKINASGKFVCYDCAELEDEKAAAACPECGESSAEFEEDGVCPECGYEKEDEGEDDEEGEEEDDK
jgi:Zn finger protein HypA/HybF involved in hydrogenase expression